MKKLVFLFTLVIATAIIYGTTNNDSLKDPKANNNKGVDSKTEKGSNKSKEVTKTTQKVTFLLYKGTQRADWSPSFWWNPQPANTGKPGC